VEVELRQDKRRNEAEYRGQVFGRLFSKVDELDDVELRWMAARVVPSEGLDHNVQVSSDPSRCGELKVKFSRRDPRAKLNVEMLVFQGGKMMTIEQ